jgi:diguanylate cyclase (GGDEF)-like protein/PAS domain S-box-containing protein
MRPLRRFLQRPYLGFAATAVACTLLIAAGWLITLERIAYERAEAEEGAQRQNSTIAAVFAQQAGRSIQTVDQAVRFLRYEYLTEGHASGMARIVNAAWIDRSLFNYVALIDAAGWVVAASTVNGASFNVADRDYFAFHAGGTDDTLHIGAPTVSRYSGAASVQFTRAIRDRGGRLQGVALVSVRPEYFTDLVRNIDIGQRGAITLAGMDGIARARRVGTEVSYGQDLSATTLMQHAAAYPSGSFSSHGLVDGVPRYTRFHAVPGYPFVAAVGSSIAETLGESRARERNYYLGAGAATLVVLLFGAGLLVAFARRREAVLQKLRSDASYRATFDEAPVGVTHTSLDGRFLKVNRKFCDMLGYTAQELLARSFHDITPPEDRDATLRARVRVLGGHPAEPEVEKRNLRKDGSVAWVVVTYSVVRDARGNPEYFVAMVRDVTRRREAEEAARRSEERYRATFEQAAVGIVHASFDGRFLRANSKYQEMVGYTEEELRGLTFLAITHPADRERVLEHDGVADRILEKRTVRKDGAIVWLRLNVATVHDAQGRPEYFLAVVQDVTERKDALAKLEHRDHYDALTELPNRALCFDRLSQVLRQARRKAWNAGVLFVDLDRFKSVNDTFGHAIGDGLLCEAGRRLCASIRAGDTVARVGGDEFAVVLAELTTPQDAALVAQKILDAFSAPLQVAGQELFVTASIGIATSPPDGDDSETLLRNADAAMHRAKEVGRDNFQFYAAEMNARSAAKLEMEGQLRRALERGEFLLHYQPKGALPGGRIAGFEALLRWQRAGNGLVSPGMFVPLLEETGMIVQAGEWVVRAACAQIAAWRDAGFVPVPVAINVSARQFAHGLYEVVRAALAEHRVDASLLEIEITESDAMQDPERVMGMLERLRVLGVTIAIDDFGTGYSSLGYLKRFPVNTLKLDRSFVTGLPDDPDDVSIARAVISMAHSLGLKVVAEGVETVAQRDFLAHDGCDQIQGYLLSKPLPAGDCARFLAREAESAVA